MAPVRDRYLLHQFKDKSETIAPVTTASSLITLLSWPAGPAPNEILLAR